MKKTKIMLLFMLTMVISPYGFSKGKPEQQFPTLSYQIIDKSNDVAINVFAFIKKPMYVSYQDDVHCNYNDTLPKHESDDIDKTAIKQIDLVENKTYQLTITPLKKESDSVETLLVFMIPEKNQNEIYKVDENCSLKLGEKTFKKYTIVQKFKLNETSTVKVGENNIEVKLIELETYKEIL